MTDTAKEEKKPESALAKGFGIGMGIISAILWCILVAIVIGFAFYGFFSFVGRGAPAPNKQPVGWTNRGPNPICHGKPKYTEFACDAFGATKCYCD